MYDYFNKRFRLLEKLPKITAKRCLFISEKPTLTKWRAQGTKSGLQIPF